MSAGTSMPPGADEDGRPFWEALARGELRLPRCEAHRHTFFPPMRSCPTCGDARVTLVPATGRGSLYSWVTTHVPLKDTHGAEVPFTVVAVDLDAGGRMLGRYLGAPDSLRPDARLTLTPFRRDGLTLPGFDLEEEHA